MSYHKVFSKIHKWVGLLIAIQLLLWTAGGFVMSYFDINEVRGDHKINPIAASAIVAGDFDAAIMGKLIENNGQAIRTVSATHLYGRPVYRIDYTGGKSVLFDSKTGERLSPLSEEAITGIAKKLYRGDAPLLQSARLAKTGIEYRGPLPVWKIDFDDSDQTSLYFSPDTGQLLAKRTRLWRVYDFMWMLHIMDYDTRDDFNHPLLYVFALTAVLFVLSGFALIYYRFGRRDFKWLGIGKKRRASHKST